MNVLERESMNLSYRAIILLFIGIIYCENKLEPAYSYKGGWPVNPQSDEIEDPGFDLPCPGNTGCECLTNADCENKNCQAHPKGNYCIPKKGDIMPRFEALDQFGESVDLYDFANQGKMILIELSAAWCSPCNDLSAWIFSNDQKIRENRWWNDRYLPVRDMINNGEIFLVNFIFEGKDKANKVTATPNDVLEWYNKYPDPHVPILADEYRFIHTWVKPTGLPCIFLVDENMRLINYTSRGLTDAFLYLTSPVK